MLGDLYDDHDSEAFFGLVPSDTSRRDQHSHLILHKIKEKHRRSQLKLIESHEDIVVDCAHDHIADDLGPESDTGYIEFKYILINVQLDRIQHLCTQMKFRLIEGSGHAIYEIGVRDNGVAAGLSDQDLIASIRTMFDMCTIIQCHCYIVHIKYGRHGKTAQLLIRRVNAKTLIEDVRICALGLTGSGKSSLIGVLLSGQLDNGNGSARTNVFRHQHELANGKTSSLTRLLIGFTSDGSIANHCYMSRTVQSMISISNRLLQFIDLAGINSRHARTTLAGLASQMPDYVCVAISSVCPLDSLETHLASVDLSILLLIPVFIVLTKVDLVTSNYGLNSVIDTISQHLSIRCVLIQDNDDIDDIVQLCMSFSCVPIIVTSSVSGHGLHLLQHFLQHLSKPDHWQIDRSLPTEFACNEVHWVGSLTVMTGIVLKGEIYVGQTLQFGPHPDGTFTPLRVDSIHVHRVEVDAAYAGQSASVVVTSAGRDQIRRGVALIDTSITAMSVNEFDAEIISGLTGIQAGFQCVAHIGSVSQLCAVSNVQKPNRVRFRFQQRSEYIRPGSRILFRHGSVQGFGFVVQ